MHGFGEIRQIAYLTDDLERAMQAWMVRGGFGPFTCYQNLTLPMNYEGEMSKVKMHVGIAFRGDMQIELIQQVNDARSPYKGFYDRRQMGLHHLAYVTDDLDASLAKAEGLGFDIIATIDAPTGRYAYFQDPVMPEVFYEFLAVPPELEAFWADSVAAAKSWSGDKTIQTIDLSNL